MLYRGGFKSTEYCLNHVEGCIHGCKYPCYANLIKKGLGKIKDYKEWIRPKLVENALELFDMEMKQHVGRISRVYMCFATDIFMKGYPEIWDLSLRIIDRLNTSEIPVTTLTKGFSLFPPFFHGKKRDTRASLAANDSPILKCA